MTKKFLILVSIGVIILGGAIFFFSRDNQPVDTSGIILFYSSGCPHCAKVDQFIEENNVASKVKFVRKEVFYNRKNADLLLKLARGCGIADKDIGVPLLWDGSKCIVGEVDIINFFTEKT